MSLVARHFEETGIPTVMIGSARDIVEEAGVARFVFSDFPLGNPCGKPNDVDMQHAIVGQALDVLETSLFPRTTVQTPFTWGDDAWRHNFMRVDDDNRAELAALGDARRQKQAREKADGSARSE